MRVLIIEDDPVLGGDLKNQFEELACVVMGPATDLEEAEELIEAKTPDLTLVDIMLEGEGTGLDVLRRNPNRTGCVMFLTSRPDLIDNELANRHPVLAKPLSEEDVLKVMELARDKRVLA